ncbi:hypothetical protein Peur_023679 [Populus x canadensis]
MKLKHGNTRIMYVIMWIVVSVCNKWKQKLHSHEALASFGSRSIGQRITSSRRTKIKHFEIVIILLLILCIGTMLTDVMLRAVCFGPACVSVYIMSSVRIMDCRNNLSRSSLLLNKKAAYDADKVFLAAFDKLEAMMPKGNFHAPDGEQLIFLTKNQVSYRHILNKPV